MIHPFGSGRTNELFAARFEPDGDSYGFRRTLRAAPIRVSRAERDAAVAAFRRGRRWLVAGLTIALLGLAAGMVMFAPATAGRHDLIFYGGIGVIMAIFMLAWLRLWSAPARRFADRRASGPERSGSEARHEMLARISWGQLALVPVMAGVILLNASRRSDILHGWGRLWLVFAGVMVLAGVVQAIRKWQIQ